MARYDRHHDGRTVWTMTTTMTTTMTMTTTNDDAEPRRLVGFARLVRRYCCCQWLGLSCPADRPAFTRLPFQSNQAPFSIRICFTCRAPLPRDHRHPPFPLTPCLLSSFLHVISLRSTAALPSTSPLLPCLRSTLLRVTSPHFSAAIPVIDIPS